MVSSLGKAAGIFLASAGLCLVAGRLVIHLLTRLGCVQPTRYDDCPPLSRYQEAKSNTPTMGGLLVLSIGIGVAALSGGLSRPEGWIVLITILSLGAVGFVDDFLKFRNPQGVGLRVKPKLFSALVIGAGIGLLSMSATEPKGICLIPFLNQPVALGWLWVPFSMLVTAGCSHAVNLTDGMDGLAAGCCLIAFVALSFVVWGSGPQGPVLSVWCISLAGACAGFLWFNGFPASVFLGDVGALGLGAALSVVSILGMAGLWLFIIGGVFVAEAFSVILQVASYKWRNKQRIFRVAPLHHHFHLGGVEEPKLIIRFWLAGLCLALLSLATMEFH